MIIAHIAHDLDALKACSLTCRSWYIAASPTPSPYPYPHELRGKLKPLSKLHQLGLMPFIKEIRVEQTWTVVHASGIQSP
jgi:hypothetical protein